MRKVIVNSISLIAEGTCASFGTVEKVRRMKNAVAFLNGIRL